MSSVPPPPDQPRGGGFPPPPPPPPGGGYPVPPGPPVGSTWQGPPLAEFSKRAQAAIIDWFGPSILAGFVQFSISWSLGALLALAALGWALYNAYLAGETGQSYGKKQAGIKLVKMSDGQLIGGAMGIVRHLAHFADGIICYIGFLFPLWDPTKQTLADKIMGTVVIEQP
ncbi:MAG: RDD family protein [Actinobacteria bacterium]|nr:RDD family protein [Actinomycetota bacterium]